MEHVFSLPHGYIDAQGKVHKSIVLRALGGYEEEILLSAARQNSATQVSKLLGNCILGIGEINNVDVNLVRDLVIEDRLFILLKLRQITFGNFIQAVVNCPESNCKEKIDIDFNISDIHFANKNDVAGYYRIKLSDAACAQAEINKPDVEFRLPNGADQEAAANFAFNNPAEVLSLLLTRCILRYAGSSDLGLEQVRVMPALVRLEIEKAIEERAGDTELSMTTQCPHCAHQFDIPFDIQDFFFSELGSSRQRLYQEVHYLAYHYHWSESEIMSMSKDKRKQYVELLAEEIERMNHAVA